MANLRTRTRTLSRDENAHARTPLTAALAAGMVLFAATTNAQLYSKPDPNQPTVTLILVADSEVCPAYRRPSAPCPPLKLMRVAQLKRTNATTAAYPLTIGETSELQLSAEFQRALVAGISAAAGYTVILEFDWKQRVMAVFDFVPAGFRQLPYWDQTHRHFYSNRYCYVSRPASDFDPALNTQWSMVLNGNAVYTFYVTGVRR